MSLSANIQSYPPITLGRPGWEMGVSGGTEPTELSERVNILDPDSNFKERDSTTQEELQPKKYPRNAEEIGDEEEIVRDPSPTPRPGYEREGSGTGMSDGQMLPRWPTGMSDFMMDEVEDGNTNAESKAVLAEYSQPIVATTAFSSVGPW